MSDRYVLHASKEKIEQTFGVSSKRKDHFKSDYNITPGTLRPIIIRNQGKRQHRQAQWGLIRPGAEEERSGKKAFALAAEEVRGDKWLEECVQQRRCLVPANGFYKWKTSKKKQTPFYIRLLSNQLMAFGGIYSVWKSKNGREVYSFALLTTRANTLVEPVDDRMPVIIGKQNYEPWLAEEPLEERIFKNLAIKPFDLTQMAVNRVSEEVNDIHINKPELIQPIPK